MVITQVEERRKSKQSSLIYRHNVQKRISRFYRVSKCLKNPYSRSGIAIFGNSNLGLILAFEDSEFDLYT
jgi:hypothetical protein